MIKNFILAHLFYLRMKSMTTVLPVRKQQSPPELEPSSKARTREVYQSAAREPLLRKRTHLDRRLERRGPCLSCVTLPIRACSKVDHIVELYIYIYIYICKVSLVLMIYWSSFVYHFTGWNGMPSIRSTPERLCLNSGEHCKSEMADTFCIMVKRLTFVRSPRINCILVNLLTFVYFLK